MTFDWSAYRTVAEALSRNADEASQRSAISRAYYCVYHQALAHLSEHHNFQYSENRPAHDQVWREFNGKGLSYREVWLKGDKLKKLRVNADYRTDFLTNAKTVAASLEMADQIIERLQQLGQKLASGRQ